MATATGSLGALALPAAMPAPVLPSPSALPHYDADALRG
jgi:hypothetical protein